MTEWDKATPDPSRYPYRPLLKPHPFMGLNKFEAGRLQQMKSGKSFLRAHSSWVNDSPTTCPSCDEAPQTFKHTILRCPAERPARSRHLQAVSDISLDARVWFSAFLLVGLARFARSTATAFPPGIFVRPSFSTESASSLPSNEVSFGYFMSSQES